MHRKSHGLTGSGFMDGHVADCLLECNKDDYECWVYPLVNGRNVSAVVAEDEIAASRKTVPRFEQRFLA